MKTTLSLLFILVVAFPGRAYGEDKAQDYIYPKLGFRELIRFVEAITKKKVEVEDEADLGRMTSLVLPNAKDNETTLKVLKALLLLEGFELAEAGDNLKLIRVLTDEQCTALNNALGRPGTWPKSEELPRERVIRGRQPMERK